MALLNSVKRGRNAMPGFQGLLRDREILDAIAGWVLTDVD